MLEYNNSLRLAIFTINIVCCFCYVNYEIFKGFDVYNNVSLEPEASETIRSVYTAALNTKNSSLKLTTTLPPLTGKRKGKHKNGTKKHTKKHPGKLKGFKERCPEKESPISLGTYEIPTQRDLVLFTKRILMKMFNSYHEKTLFLLKDIKEATRATQVFEKSCTIMNRASYKSCVKIISKKCVAVTKDLVESMERQREEVSALVEGTTCNMTEMRTDPIELIKTLAMDEASLDFALPAFLRLIGGCSAHCTKQPDKTLRRPSRHMTDQDLVVRHFLTKKNYIQLIKDSDTHV